MLALYTFSAWRVLRADVMLAVVQMAEVGGAIPADEAISQIATLIDRLEKSSDTYENDVIEARAEGGLGHYGG